MLKIKEIRLQKNLSQDEIVLRTGIAKRSYVDYENGKTDIPLSKLQNIAINLGVSVGELLGEKQEVHTVIKEPSVDYNKTPTVITVDSINRENIVMVPHRIHAGYLNSYNDPQFIQTLPAYRLPNLNNGIFRMFEVEGNSMFPTFHDKSIVVGQFVENWEKDIKDNRCYVVISNEIEDGFVKRCVNKIKKYNNLICKSDNRRNYPAQNIDPSTIKEVWEVKASLNFQFPDPADLYDKVIDMEAELLSLKNILKNQKFLP